MPLDMSEFEANQRPTEKKKKDPGWNQKPPPKNPGKPNPPAERSHGNDKK